MNGNRQPHYATVSVSVLPNGVMFSMWFSTSDAWRFERYNYPYDYTALTDENAWFIRSNVELTQKIVGACAEGADASMRRAIAQNYQRKVVNR